MLSDLRLAVRQLLRTPGFTAIALLTLALGIGLNTSMFTVVNTLLFNRLGFAEPDRLVRIFRTSPQSQRWPHSAGAFTDLRAQAKSFAALAAYNQTNANLSEPDQPAERLRAIDATADFFPLLGVQPALGRYFTAAECQPGAAPVVVLSHATWLRRFGGDPGVVGRSLKIDGALATVVGVMPPEFNPPLFWGQIELWRPLAFTAAQESNRSSNYLSIVARLAPGTSHAQAGAELGAISARWVQDFPDTAAGSGLRQLPFAIANQNSSARQMTWLIMALAGFVLLIACANLANLQFARTTGRARDYAIRIALGAPRWRIMRELLTESLTISLGGAACGLLVALWANDFLAARIGSSTPGLTLALDWRVFCFTLAAATLSGVAMGLLPAWSAARADINDTLKQQARGSTGDRAHHRVRHGLIVTEIALALVLLAGAGVFVRGLQRFTARDVGWQPAGLLSGYVSLPAARYADEAARIAFYDKLAAALAANPAFTNSALASSVPVYGYNSSTTRVAEGQPLPPPGQEPLMNIVSVTPGFFGTMGVRLVAGRNFDAHDRAGGKRVCIINQSLAQALWPGESPLGKRLGDSDPSDPQWAEVVGVVNDVGAAASLTPPDTRYQLYTPLLQESWGFFAVVVRGHTAPELLREELRRMVAAIDPDQPVHGVNPMAADIGQALDNFRLMGELISGFAVLGLALAALGIYGVLAGFVAQRRAEIGVRMALGAQVGDVLRLVLGRGLWLAALGTAVGLFGAFALVRLLGRILPELGPPDLAAVGVVVTALLAVAFLACWLPARRATRVNPVDALRAE
jgi:putative ABC transport system permease protein